MPRTARDQSATGIYHVMIRGINRQDIFETPEDYRKFIETLASLREVVSEDMRTKICTCHIVVTGTGTWVENCHENRHPYPGACPRDYP